MAETMFFKSRKVNQTYVSITNINVKKYFYPFFYVILPTNMKKKLHIHHQ